MGCCSGADQEKYDELKRFIDALPTKHGSLTLFNEPLSYTLP